MDSKQKKCMHKILKIIYFIHSIETSESLRLTIQIYIYFCVKVMFLPLICFITIIIWLI